MDGARTPENNVSIAQETHIIDADTCGHPGDQARHLDVRVDAARTAGLHVREEAWQPGVLR